MKKVKLFIDTMIFLHYRPLRELDLPTLLESDDITIVIPRITLRELEKHKSGLKKKRIRERSRKILNQLYESIVNENRFQDLFNVEAFLEFPDEMMEKLKLNPEWADDVLVAAVATYKNRHNESEVVLATQDTALKISCHHHGIKTIQINESKMVSEELDEFELENRSLKEKLGRLESSAPDLDTGFLHETEISVFHEFEVGEESELEESEVADYLTEVKEKFPQAELSNDLSSSTFDNGLLQQFLLATNSPFYGIDQSQLSQYNEELELFYKKAEEYFRLNRRVSQIKARTISFIVAIVNNGDSPADDVDLELRFPPEINLKTEEELLPYPAIPKPPEKPVSMMERLNSSMIAPDSVFASKHGFEGIHSSLFERQPTLRIEKEIDSCVVSYHDERVKHSFRSILPELFIEFPTAESLISFKCDFKLSAANLRSPKTGTLHFVHKK